MRVNWSYYTLVTWIPVLMVHGVQLGWRPLKSRPNLIIGPKISRPRHRIPSLLDTCSLYKVTMDQRNFHQYAQYKHHIPEMKEFTLCAWHKLYNHSVDHPIFSYALPHKSRAILSWISCNGKKSYYMLAVNGHTMYRLNYPLKLHKWYHMCQSWNGKTGEWQLWVNNERVGRGYYNLMVGKPIKGGGVAMSGQEQMEYGGGFNLKGENVGMQGELTLIQLYKAALTVGKAYTDHKHHHVHEWEDSNNDVNPEENPEEGINYAALNGLATEQDNPDFENGQKKHKLPVDELFAKNPSTPNILGNLGSLEDADSLKFQSYEDSIFTPQDYKFIKRISTGPVKFDVIRKRVSIRSKRNAYNASRTDHWMREGTSRDQRWAPQDDNWHPKIPDTMLPPLMEVENRQRNPENNGSARVINLENGDRIETSNHKKRGLVVEEHIFSPLEFISSSGISNLDPHSDGQDIPPDHSHGSQRKPFQLFATNDFPKPNLLEYFKYENPPIEPALTSKTEFEPAEWEVRKISELCSGCGEDAFRKANVLPWQDTPKKLYGGAEYVPAIPHCHIF